MTRKKYGRRYSPEFKREALRRASEDGITDKQVCEELGISARQLARWRDELRLLGDQAFPGSGNSRDEEMTRLKKELAKVKQERDFLKQAAVFFAKESK
jgi:transposase